MAKHEWSPEMKTLGERIEEVAQGMVTAGAKFLDETPPPDPPQFAEDPRLPGWLVPVNQAADQLLASMRSASGGMDTPEALQRAIRSVMIVHAEGWEKLASDLAK